MESTGVYWIPVYQVLKEHGFDVKAGRRAAMKNVPGRKTDVVDCHGFSSCTAMGYWRGCFIPEPDIAVLRILATQGIARGIGFAGDPSYAEVVGTE